MKKTFRSLAIELSFVFAILVCFTSACYAEAILGYEVPACGKSNKSLAFSELTARNIFSGKIDSSKVIISRKDFEEKYLPKYIAKFDTPKYGKRSNRLCLLAYEFQNQENVRLNDFDADLFVKEFIGKKSAAFFESMYDLLVATLTPGFTESTTSPIESDECLIQMDSESMSPTDPDSTSSEEILALINAYSTIIPIEPDECLTQTDSESMSPKDTDITNSDEMLALTNDHSTLIAMTPRESFTPDINTYIKSADDVISPLIPQPRETGLASQSIKSESQTLAQIKKIYTQLLGALTFDEKVGDEMMKASEGKTLGETFKMDVEATKTLKKGVCRQFANRIISELYEIGVQAHSLIIINADDTSHIAVLYEIDKQHYVADLSREIQYCKLLPSFYNKSTPVLNAMPLQDYIELNKGAKSIAFCNEILTDNPKTFCTANFVPLYMSSL